MVRGAQGGGGAHRCKVVHHTPATATQHDSCGWASLCMGMPQEGHGPLKYSSTYQNQYIIWYTWYIIGHIIWYIIWHIWHIGYIIQTPWIPDSPMPWLMRR